MGPGSRPGPPTDLGVCPAPFAKIFLFFRNQNQAISVAVPPHRGAYHDRRLRGAGCDGRDSVGRARRSQGEMNLVSDLRRADERRCQLFSPELAGSHEVRLDPWRDGRVRRSRVVLTPRRWRQVLRRCIRPNRVSNASSIRKATVARKPGHRGEHEVSREPIRAGKAGVIRLNLWSTRAFFVRTTAGAIGIRLSLRPLFAKEGETDANLGCFPRRENAELRLVVIASEAKQSILSLRRAMDCFVASAPRNDGGAV
jgi:hypothetical protein